MSEAYQSLTHSRWNCKCHIVDVAKVLIASQMSQPNATRLLKSPRTRSRICSICAKQTVRRTQRLSRVRRLIWLLSIFWASSRAAHGLSPTTCCDLNKGLTK